jgi:hypothetical protein
MGGVLWDVRLLLWQFLNEESGAWHMTDGRWRHVSGD